MPDFFRTHTWLGRAFAHSKALGWALSLFVAGTLGSSLLGDETTPFFVWGMFSDRWAVQPSYAVFELVADGDTIDYANGFTDFQRHMIKSPLAYYARAEALGGADPNIAFVRGKLPAGLGQGPAFAWLAARAGFGPDQYAAYLPWLKRYLGRSLGREIGHLRIHRLHLRYGPDGQPRLLRRELFAEI